MTNPFTKQDRQAGCLTGLMLFIGMLGIIFAFFHGGRESFIYNLALGFGMGAPLILPLLAIVIMRRSSKMGAALLLSAIIALMLMVAVLWVLVADELVNSSLAEGLATELVGAVFTAVAIVAIEQAIQIFTSEDEMPPSE